MCLSLYKYCKYCRWDVFFPTFSEGNSTQYIRIYAKLVLLQTVKWGIHSDIGQDLSFDTTTEVQTFLDFVLGSWPVKSLFKVRSNRRRHLHSHVHRVRKKWTSVSTFFPGYTICTEVLLHCIEVHWPFSTWACMVFSAVAGRAGGAAAIPQSDVLLADSFVLHCLPPRPEDSFTAGPPEANSSPHTSLSKHFRSNMLLSSDISVTHWM